MTEKDTAQRIAQHLIADGFDVAEFRAGLKRFKRAKEGGRS